MKKKLINILSIFTCCIALLAGCGKYTQEDMDAIELEKTQLQNAHDNLSEMYSKLKVENEELTSQLNTLNTSIDADKGLMILANHELYYCERYLEGMIDLDECYAELTRIIEVEAPFLSLLGYSPVIEEGTSDYTIFQYMCSCYFCIESIYNADGEYSVETFSACCDLLSEAIGY